MLVLEKYVFYEETIKNSRFLSELIPCDEQSRAREIIKEQKNKYPEARHVVHGFVIGKSGEICGMSDDGEPSGTAGRPLLDVLRGHDCTNTLLTITRWFGGILLGTGGLVKAYGGGAKAVLAKADEEGAFVPLVEKKAFSFAVDYSFYKIARKILQDFNIFDLKEDFGTEISISGKIEASQSDFFSHKINDASNGKITVTL